MNTNQKGFANIVLIVILVVVLGIAVGYFALRKPIQPQVTPPAITNNTQIQPSNNQDTLRKKLQNVTLDVTLYTSKNPATARVTLVNGKYEYQSNMCSPQSCTFTLAAPQFVDIDKDGIQDVVAIGSAWNGGNKTLQSAEIFLNKNGELSYVGGIPIGTTPEIESIATEKNQITIGYNSTYNGAAGWSNPVSVTYKIENGKLVKVQ